jgi:uncharacterized protein YndB with AHSA1/START domain
MTAERPTPDGTVEKEPDGSTTVRFDRRLRHPTERVWQALTDPDELRRWWGDTKLELVEGGPFQLRWRNTDENGDVATLDGTITSIDPPCRLEISADWGSTAAGQPGTRTHLTSELETRRRPHPAPLHQQGRRPRPGRPHSRRLAPAPRRPRHHPRRRRGRHHPPRRPVRPNPPGLHREVRPRPSAERPRNAPGHRAPSVELGSRFGAVAGFVEAGARSVEAGAGLVGVVAGHVEIGVEDFGLGA